MGTRPSKKLQQTKVAKGIADARNVAMYQTGTELGTQASKADRGIKKADWVGALKRIKTPKDRKALRDGFIDVYAEALKADLGSKAKVSAENRFDYLARLYGKASTSRQAKANAKKKSGRKVRFTAGEQHDVPVDELGARLAAVTHWFAEMQTKWADHADILEDLGIGAALANPSKPKSKRKSKEKEIRAMIAKQLHI